MYIYSKKRRCCRTDPWGMPQFKMARPILYPVIDIYWLWLDRQDLIQSFETPWIPQWFSFANSSWCAIVSRAFYKSTKTPQPIFPSLRAFLIFSVMLIKIWDVEYYFLNPTVSYR